MKLCMITVLITSLVSVSAFANMDIHHAEMNYSAAKAHYDNEAYRNGWGGATRATPAMNEAGAIRAQAYADNKAGEAANAAAKARSITNYGVKQSGVAQYSEPAKTPSYFGTSQRPGTVTNMAGYGVKQSGTPQYSEPVGKVAYSGTSTRPATVTNMTGYGVKHSGTPQYSEPTNTPTYSGVSQRPATVTNNAAYGIKQSGTPQYSEPMGDANYSGVSHRSATNSTINQAASSLPTNTPVDTENGLTTAGEIAAVNPNAQIAVEFNSPFEKAPKHSEHSGRDQNDNGNHGTGNGSNNAANSNSAHGLGGGNHIGGGSAQSGSRNVGQW